MKGSTPPNNLPPRRMFIGREEELRALEHQMESPAAQRRSLYGLGGVGKTALALEFAHRATERGDYPGGVWWVGADFRPVEALVRLAHVLRAVGPQEVREVLAATMSVDTSAIRIAEAVKLALQNQREPSLLVLDNLDTEGWAAQLPGGAVRVLATTRDKRLALGVCGSLDVLLPQEARALARAIAPPAAAGSDEDTALDWVVTGELGALAVAVEVAALAVERWALSWTAYAQHLREEMERVLDDPDLRSGDYPHSVFAALELSIERCQPGTPERRLLEGATIFAPSAIPLAWAEAAAGLAPGSLDAAKARAALRGLGLVTVDERAQELSIHRLVHRCVRHQAPREDWFAAIRRGAAHVIAWLIKTVDTIRLAEVDAQRPHIEELLLATEQAGIHGAWIAIANRLATHLQHRALYNEARELFERVLARSEGMEPPDLRQIATSLSNLALLLRDAGRAAEACALLERSLKIAEELYGPDHRKVSTRLSNLAAVLHDTERAVEARPLLERSLRIAIKTYGAEHPKIAAILSNLAMVLIETDQEEQALTLLQIALRITETTHGPDHPQVAVILSNLASCVQKLATTSEECARLTLLVTPEEISADDELPRLDEVLAKLGIKPQEEEVMPCEDVARTMMVGSTLGTTNMALPSGWAKVISQMREYQKTDELAFKLLQRALAIEEKSYGPYHPRVLATRSALARAHKLI